MPQPRFEPKAVKRVVIKPLPKRPKTKGFFEQHYYGTLGSIFFFSAFVFKGFGSSFRDCVVCGLWVAVFVAFVWTLVRYFQHRTEQLQVKAPSRADRRKPLFKPVSAPPGKYPYYGPKKPQP